MSLLRTILLGLLAFVSAAVLVGPFLIPIRPLEGLQAPEQLADPDSRFAEVDGVKLHYKVMGSGEPVMVLLHGFAASIYSWREVMAPLAKLGTVIALDRPSSGLTERPMPGEWTGRSPYSAEAQADQVTGLLSTLGVEKAVLIGNSAGGTIAVLTALRHPERVRALVLVDAAIYTSGGAPGWAGPLLHTPQMDRVGILIVRNFSSLGTRLLNQAWHDPSKFKPEWLEGYRRQIQVIDWDRGLWELTKASKPLKLDRRLPELTMPALVITGDDDRIVPTAESVRLAGELPDARLVVIPDCGHTPQEECPQAFLSAAEAFVSGL